MNTKAIYYTLDALFATLLLAGVILLLFQSQYYEPSVDVVTEFTRDALLVLETIKISELNSSWVVADIANGTIYDPSVSVLDQIAAYWSQNDTAKATLLFTEVFSEVLPLVDSVALLAENDTLFMKGSPDEYDALVSTSRMITGVQQGEALRGSSSSGYLKKIRNKKTASYVYLGGYVGQGNISVSLLLPEDYDASAFSDAVMKLETTGNFSLTINGQSCGSTFQGAMGAVSQWSLVACNASFQDGENSISFLFNSELNLSAISGGFVRVTHTTDMLNEDTQGYARYQFPSISGFINLYDSFSVQGVITNYTANLTLYSEYDTFLTVINDTVLYIPGSNVTKTVVYTEQNITLPPTQLPLRLGTTNLSNVSIQTGGVATDSFLVTDVSGSMDDCGQYFTSDVEYCAYEHFFWIGWFPVECPYTGSCSANECGAWGSPRRNHYVYNKSVSTCNQTLLEIAQSADALFVDEVLSNSTINKIGLVDFSTNANTPTGLTNVQGVLNSEIETYVASGGTCTCCGINRAKDLLLNSSNKRFMIVLSDGEPTLYCNGFSDYTGSSGDNAQSRQDAIDSGQEACNNNITVYTIGFGESMSATGHSVMQQTACNSSLYYNATDVSDLAQIYEDISQAVLLSANYSSQTISIAGNYSPSLLSGDSYIDVWYSPLEVNATQGRLSVTFESEEFLSCSTNIALPDGIRIVDAAVTSFSSNHWTKSLVVNDEVVFNLTDYGTDYSVLGDPFLIQIPTTFLREGELNSFMLEVGDTAMNASSCSENNTLIYTALIDSATARSDVYDVYEGCSWTIQTENDILNYLQVPADYGGTNACSYTSSSISYNSEDAYDAATFQLLSQLDPDDNGKILVDLEETDLEITITLVSGVPYLWGPSLLSIQTWK